MGGMLHQIATFASYVMLLFMGWAVIPLLMLFIALPVASRLGIVANRRGYLTLAIPLATLVQKIVLGLGKVLLPLFAVAVSLGWKGGPPVNRFLAHQIFGWAYILYLMVAVPLALGLPLVATAGQLPVRTQARLTFIRLSLGCGLGYVVTKWPGEYGWVAATGGFAFLCVLGTFTVRGLAAANLAAAPTAREIPHGLDGRPYFVQISDIHTTVPPGAQPGGGGRAGVGELEAVADWVSSAEPAARPRLVIDTGDVVDRGREREWERPLEWFRKIRAAGVRVVLTPGNHDLVLTYDAWPAMFATAARHITGLNVDGNRILKYFTAASELEAELRTASGDSLARMLKNMAERKEAVIGALEAARAKADQAIGRRLSSHYHAMNKLGQVDPALLARLSVEFCAIGRAQYPEWPQINWEHLLVTPATMEGLGMILGQVWEQRWAGLFPLRLELPDDGVEILVLNSVPKELALGPSARGACGVEQLERAKDRMAKSDARIVLVLHHHAVFRFLPEPPRLEVQRWALLNHDPAESRTLAAIMVNAAAARKQVLLLSGHIHLRSRVGQLEPENGVAPLAGSWVLESGALGEAATDVLPAAVMTGAGVLQPGLVRRP